jgi:dihydrofolate synthase / folylpolyglutamate synthase
MTATELQDWLLAHYGRETFLPGLERIRNYLHPDIAAVESIQPLIITVAGTNGKGETALTLAELARQQGIPFVLWTSPHLLSVTERFKNNQGEIPVGELASLLFAGEVTRRQHGVGLSYYEALWAAFLRWGFQQKARLWILEVGLGGRLDAVNVLNADVVALCSISRDHQEYLGPTYRQILQEKLGVLRPGKSLVSALELRYLREQTQSAVTQGQNTWMDLFETGQLLCQSSFSERNRQLALASWRALGFSAQSAPQAVFAGRGECWSWQGHEFVFYGSHNPDGMRKMVQFLQSNSYNLGKEFFHQIWTAFSQRPATDLRSMVKMVAGLATPETTVFITRFTHPKAAGPDGWWRHGEGSSATYIHEWTELFSQLDASRPRRILVVGSYYFVAHVQAHLLTLGAAPGGQRG